MKPITILALMSALFLAAGTTLAEKVAWTAREPAADVRQLAPVIRDIRSLQSLNSEIEQLERDMDATPTNARNMMQRFPLMVAYYDALQANGVLLNWRINSELNWITRSAISNLKGDRQLPMAAILDHRFKELRRADLLTNKTGRLRLQSPSHPVLQAKSYATVKLTYEVQTPLQEGARIRIGQNWYSDLGRLQFQRPLDANYATARTNRTSVTLLTANRYWFGNSFTGLSGGNTPHLILQGDSLGKGDSIDIVLGDTSEGSPGWLIQSFTSDAMDLKIEIDFLGDGVFVPVAQPRFKVIGSKPDHIRAVAPSVIRPRETFTVRASVEDEYSNRTSRPPAKLYLYQGKKLLASTRSNRADRSVFHFEDIAVNTEPDTPIYLSVRDRAGHLTGTANPLVVRTTADRLYWGEMHGHEGYTDANGSPEWYMNYAKNVAFLDYASLTGHDLMLSEVHFRDIFRASDSYHNPADGFVSIRAYEWTNGWQFGGHHNVFMMNDQRVVSVMQAGTLEEMYRLHLDWNDPAKVLIIPHAHAPGDWDIKGLAELVEIFSQHGSFEWFGQGYLKRGHRVGFNAAADDHVGHPGNSPSRGRSRGGLAAVFAPDLSRESVMNNLKARRTYATSFERIYLETTINDKGMGEVFTIGNAERNNLKLKGFVAGTGPIAEVTAVVNGVDAISHRYDQSPDNTSVLRFRLTRSSEPNNPLTPRVPAPDQRYWGRILLGSVKPVDHPVGSSRTGGGSTRILALRPLGIEHYGDHQDHTGNREVTFSWRVRGDYDGVLLDLVDVDPNDQVSVLIYKSPQFATEYWNTQEQPRLPGEYWSADVPQQDVLLRETVRLGDLLDGTWTAAFDEIAEADLALVNDKAPRYRNFTFDLSSTSELKSGEDNYVYVRVRQLNDETAWSSPIFLDWQ